MPVEVPEEIIFPDPKNERERDIFNIIQDAHRQIVGSLDSSIDEKVKASSGDATAGYLDAKVDDATIEVSSDLLQLKDGGISTSKIADNAIDKDKINADIAGAGLSQAAGGELDVSVDNSTLEISTDTLRIKDNGVTTSKILNSNVTKAKIENLSDYTVLGNVSGISAAPSEVLIKDEDDMTSNSNTALITQQSLVAYLAAQLSALSFLTGFGSWTSGTFGSSTQAASPGILIVIASGETANDVGDYLSIKTDSSNPPTTIRAHASPFSADDTNLKISLICPIKESDYYLVEDNGDGFTGETVYFLPFA